MTDELGRILARLERATRDLRAYGQRVGAIPGDASAETWSDERDRAEWPRRLRDPRWKRIGELLHAIYKKGGRVTTLQWLTLAVGRFGYPDARALNGYFRGTPPVVRREGDEVVLTERGEAAARFWREHFGRKGRR
jgi:hypothetical protein